MSRIKKILNFKVFLIFNLVVVGFLSVKSAEEYLRKHQIDEEIQKLQAEAENYENKNLEILRLSKYLNSGNFLEKEARAKLGLAKPGESVVIVQGLEEDAKSPLKSKDDSFSNPKKWLRYFTGAYYPNTKSP